MLFEYQNNVNKLLSFSQNWFLRSLKSFQVLNNQ